MVPKRGTWNLGPEVVNKSAELFTHSAHGLLLQFIRPAVVAMPAHERAAVTTHSHLRRGFPQLPRPLQWWCIRSMVRGALAGLQSCCRGGCRRDADPFRSVRVDYKASTAPIQLVQSRSAGPCYHQRVWCNLMLCATMLRALQQQTTRRASGASPQLGDSLALT